MDVQHILKAAGRWNRAGDYGALYTAESARCAAAEFRKRIDQYGIDRPRDLFELQVRADPVWNLLQGRFPPRRPQPKAAATGPPQGDILGNRPEDLELCRTVADRLREGGYVGLRAPSAADPSGVVFILCPENRPAEIELRVVRGPVPLNHGGTPFLDPEGFPTRDRP